MTTAIAVDCGHVEPVDVHFDDLDFMGIVHNARYALLVERALTRFWQRHGIGFQDGAPTHPDAFHAVGEFSITYHTPVRGPGTVGVHFWIDRLGTSSAHYGFRIVALDGSVVHASGRRVNIRLDPTNLRPAPLTPEGRAIAEGLLRSTT
jgi:acyl-CoA thioester hydrolase